MKKVLMLVVCFHFIVSISRAQVKIGDNPGAISTGSILELESTSKALTLPRMTTVQMQAIPSPLNGMIIFNTDSNCIYLYKTNNVWASISADAPAAANWPYRSNDNVIGTPGNRAGIISLTGSGLVASGEYSHAEGLNSVASGNYAWSSGISDTASGAASMAIGSQNRALGLYSFAAGFKNIAGYQSSFTMGQENADSGWASLAVGIRNKIFNQISYSNALGYENEIRGGSSNTVMGESNIVQSGRAMVNMGYANIITAGNYSSTFGTSNDVLAGNSHFTGGENNTIKSGNANSIFGQNNIADGNYLGSMGRDNIVFYQSAMAFGQGNKDSGWASIAGGLNNTILEGVQYASTFGNNNRVNAGVSSVLLGESNTLNGGKGNALIGYLNAGEGDYNIAAGTINNIVSGTANSVFGQNNIADGSYLGAIGKDNIVFFQSSIALGQSNKDSGRASITGGLNNTIRSGVQYSNAFGNGNQLNSGTAHTALGESNIVTSGRANGTFGFANIIEAGNYSNTFGTANDVLAGNSHITGGENNTVKSGNANSIFGQNNFAEGSYLGALGKDNIVFYQSSVALGQGNKDSGFASIAGGLNNVVKTGVLYSSMLGNANLVNAGSSHTLLGESNLIKAGRANSTMGYANIIDAGNYSNAFGTANDVVAGNSHVAGGENNTVRSGNANTVFGQNNIAEGSYLGAIGKDNIVFYQSSVALGQSNRDSGWASVAGGLGNVIEEGVKFSATFGSNNIASANPSLSVANSGVGTFTAGLNNYNSGYASIALGASNMPSNMYSLSANYSTLSNSFGMSSFGHFNDTASALQGTSYQPGEMLFSIGNGTSTTARRNSFTMLRNGFTSINTTAEQGANMPRAELDVKGTGAIIVPVGTSAQRPETPVTGMIRFCTDCGSTPVLQGFDGTNWVNL